MTDRHAALLRRRWVVPADQLDARAEEGDEATSEDDGPGRAVDDDYANDDKYSGKHEPRPCCVLEDGHDDLPSRQLAPSGQLAPTVYRRTCGCNRVVLRGTSGTAAGRRKQHSAV